MANTSSLNLPNLNHLATITPSEEEEISPLSPPLNKTPIVESSIVVKPKCLCQPKIPIDFSAETSDGKLLGRPDWLPENWKIESRLRASGDSAGKIDKYYVEPSGQRKFRSKNEVLHFLETGSKLKRKANADSDAQPSGSSATPKKKSSSAKQTKSATEAGKEM